jgi:molecular chaperone GrpE
MTEEKKDTDNVIDEEVSEETVDTETAEAEEEVPAEETEEKKESDDARYMRLAADFQNYKRRAEKEKSDIYQYANEKIAVDIIDVMDNFERALAHSDECEDKQFAEGVSMIYKQLKGVLDKNNIIEIASDGEPFDPNVHNAVMAEENPEYESGIVIQTMQKGYTLNGKVIRPSMVKVAQ